MFLHSRLITLDNHLENGERAKGKGKWIFARHSRQHMISCYRYVRDRNVCAQSAETFEEGLERALKQAIAGKLVPAKDEGGGNFDIIEVINGNVKNPVFIRVTPDVDVEALRKRWCEDYCRRMGMLCLRFPTLPISKQEEAAVIMLLDETYQEIKTVNTEEQLFLYLKESCRPPDEQNWRFAGILISCLLPF